MRSRLKSVIVGSIAVITLIVAAAALFLLSASPADYQTRLVAALHREAGVELRPAQAADWQLWPPGLHLGALNLQDAVTHEALLQARGARVDIDIGALFGGHVRIAGITLEDADIFWRHHGKGSNWTPLLDRMAQHSKTTTGRMALRESRLHLTGSDDRSIADIDIGTLDLQLLADGKGWPLSATFDVNAKGKTANLLTQNTLQARISPRENGVTISGARLHTQLSSTLFPGLVTLDLQGDLQAQEGQLTSPALSANGTYKNISMDAALPFRFSAPLQADPATGLQLQGWQFSLGDAAKPAASGHANITVDWQHDLSATLQDGELQAGKMRATALRLVAIKAGNTVTMDPLQGNAGTGTFSVPLVIDGSSDVPVLTMKPFLHDIDMAPLAPLLDASGELSGTLDLNGHLQLSGTSPRAWQETAQGRLSLRARDVHIAGTDMKKNLIEKLQSYKTFLPELAATPADTKQGGALGIAADSTVADGSTRSTADISLDGTRIHAEGNWRNDHQAMDYTASMHLEKSLFAAAQKEVILPIVCKGNPAEEQLDFLEAINADCKVADEFVHRTLANTLSRRFLDK